MVTPATGNNEVCRIVGGGSLPTGAGRIYASWPFAVLTADTGGVTV